MSIAPFLPGLPVPATPDGAATPDASTGDPGSAGSGFGEALAAALAGSLVVPPSGTAPVTTATPPPASAELPVPPAELAVPPAELAVPSAELAVPRGELGVSRGELGVSPAELPVAAQTGPPIASAGSTTEGAPAFRRTTNAAEAPAGGAAVSGLVTTDSEAVPARGNANSTIETANSASGTRDSTVETANSASETANSAVATANPAGAVTKAVVQQVFPEVTRIVSTVITPAPGAPGPANGTHRITLTLQPEQLGEVRVTLVVRDGAVHVRLAGAEGAEGAAVHRALAGEAPELQRILERTGAEARVTVRDPFAPLLPTAPTAASAPSGLQTGPDAHGRSETQARQDRQDGQAAREQPREQPRRQQPQQASYPIAPIPVAGRLDRTV